MTNEKRMIVYEQAKRATYEEIFWTESEQAVVRNFLAKLPKVDAVEVVHGRWLKTEVEAGDPYDGNSVYCFDVMMCSVCGCHFDVSEAMNYCPNCGAKMDGERKDNG